MSSSIVIAQVKQELKHILKGRGVQNRLRAIYNAMRRSHLATHGDHYPPSATLKQAKALLGSLSGTQPQYDQAFFAERTRI